MVVVAVAVVVVVVEAVEMIVQWLTKLFQCFVVLDRWTWCGVIM